MKHTIAGIFAAALLASCGPADQATASAEPAPSAAAEIQPLPEITIYHLEGRRSERIVWLMEELEMPYELVFVRGNLLASMQKIRELGHEMPMAPTVVYGDQILVEYGAIIDVILARHAPGKLTPAIDSDDYAHHVKWMHYAEGSLAARLFSDYRAWRTNPPKNRSWLVDSEAVVQYSENWLAENPWFGGQSFSSADIMMTFPLNVATSLNLVDEQQFPHIAEWKTRIEGRPAYKRMLAKARPDGMIGSLPPVQHPPSDSRQR